LRGKPVAVVPVETDSTSAIAASYEAKAFGVKTGTKIHEAKRLCPGLICVLARHECYVDFHHRLVEEIERHLPVTAVCSIDEVACRLMDNEVSVERSTELAHSIKSGIAKNIGPYMRCSIGIAPNRYLAKVGTELQKPDGLVVLQAADLPQKLSVSNCGIRNRRQHRASHPDSWHYGFAGSVCTRSTTAAQDLGQRMG
jgi:DNA polymerase IV